MSADDIVVSVPWTWVPTPNHGGERARTLGVVIHSTRGGTSSLQAEYEATVSFCASVNPSQVGPTWVVGPSQVTRMIEDRLISWCQTVDNDTHLGIEVAQPNDNWAYVDFQYQATAEICARYVVKYGFPAVYIGKQYTDNVEKPGILGHEDTKAGWSRGKTDPGHMWDWGKFMGLVQAKVRELTTPEIAIPADVQAYIEAHGLGQARVGPSLSYRDGAGDWVVKTTTGAVVIRRAYDPPGDQTVQIEHVDWKADAAPIDKAGIAAALDLAAGEIAKAKGLLG